MRPSVSRRALLSRLLLAPVAAGAVLATTAAFAQDAVGGAARPPAMQSVMISLKGVPRRTFAGLQQDRVARPLWSLPHPDALGQPVISADGKWLVLTRPGADSGLGETLLVVDLAAHRVSEHPVPAPGLAGAATFDRGGSALLGIVNTAEGHALARWDFPALHLMTSPLGPGRAVGAALTHAQKKAIVLKDDGSLAVYALPAATPLLAIAAPAGPAQAATAAIAVSPDDAVCITGVAQPANRLIAWRLSDGGRVDTPIARDPLAWGRSATYTRAGAALLVADGQSLTLRDAESGERLAAYASRGIQSVVDIPDLDLAAAPLGDGDSAGVIDTMSGQVRLWAQPAPTPGAARKVGWVCVAPDGRTAYAGDRTGITAWDLAAELDATPDWLNAGRAASAVFPSPDGRHLVALGETVDTWSLVTRRLLKSQPSPLLRDPRSGANRAGARVLGTFAIGEDVFAVIDDEIAPQVVALAGGRAGERLGAPRSALARSAGQALPTAAAIWPALRGTPRQWPEVFPEGDRFRLEASLDGTQLLVAAAGAHASVSLWNLVTGRRIAVLADETAAPGLARLSLDGRHAVVASERGEIALFPLATGRAAAPTFITGRVLGSARADAGPADLVMPTTDRLYVGARDGTLTVWARDDGAWYRRAKISLGAPIGRLALSPDQTRLALCLADAAERRSVVVLDGETGRVTDRLDDAATDACFVSETLLATNTLHLWTLRAK